MNKLFSVIVPVYNRPDEVDELLHSLSRQTVKNFEVIIVEDGSAKPCAHVVERYTEQLSLVYFFKPNSGPGDTRNVGITKANTDFFIFLDSDCILPDTYFEQLTIAYSKTEIACFGGPDKAHESFTDVQKAISYSMTSFLTTGGIRGGSKKVTKFHPRSFNMGFSRKVYELTQGFANMRFGEDVDFSLRVEEAGISCVLLPACFVYHKRRTDFTKFYRQIYNSGIARINLFKRHPHSLKITHFFPAAFVGFAALAILCVLLFQQAIPLFLLVVYLTFIFADATMEYKSLRIGWLAVVATCVQMTSYGLGFIKAVWIRLILGKDEFRAFDHNFYK